MPNYFDARRAREAAEKARDAHGSAALDMALTNVRRATGLGEYSIQYRVGKVERQNLTNSDLIVLQQLGYDVQMMTDPKTGYATIKISW